MKTKPSEGKRVWYWDDYGVKVRGTVYRVDAAGIVHIKPDHYSVVVELHYTRLSGFIRKKPRKCEECAKPKELFYLWHNNESIDGGQGILTQEKPLTVKLGYISTLALISTEEVKK